MSISWILEGGRRPGLINAPSEHGMSRNVKTASCLFVTYCWALIKPISALRSRWPWGRIGDAIEGSDIVGSLTCGEDQIFVCDIVVKLVRIHHMLLRQALSLENP